MAGAITLSGLGSGLDIESIVSGLVNASSQPVKTAQTKATDAQAAISALSGIGSLLGELRTAVDALDTASELASYSGISSNTDALTVSTSGLARPAAYNITNVTLAQEQRNYTDGVASKTDDFGSVGTMTFTQGGTNYVLNIAATDSLEDIGSKINGMGASITSAVISTTDGYRLQIRSKETGNDQAFTIDESGLSKKTGANGDTGTLGSGRYQSAMNASLTVDGLQITSKTNTVGDAIEGVSIELKKATTTPFTVTVRADTDKMKKSLDDFVNKYNSVISRIHSVAGFGETKGSSAALKADSSLRSMTNRLSGQVLSGAGTGGSLDTLADLGIRLNSNGTLRVDSTQMSKALLSNPDAFTKALAGTDTSDGLMDKMSDLVKSFGETGSGALDIRKQALQNSVKLFQATAEREQKRLTQMETRLRTSFSAMDAQMGNNNVTMNYLARI
jgi:flagellar hook-associated protein 2